MGEASLDKGVCCDFWDRNLRDAELVEGKDLVSPPPEAGVQIAGVCWQSSPSAQDHGFTGGQQVSFPAKGHAHSRVQVKPRVCSWQGWRRRPVHRFTLGHGVNPGRTNWVRSEGCGHGTAACDFHKGTI